MFFLSSKDKNIYNVFIHWFLYALFFFLPIFFLPFTSEFLEINKQTLLIVLTLVTLLIWLGSMVMEKKLVFRSSWLNFLPVLFLLTVSVSSVFSLAGYQTWVGQAEQEYTSFLTTVVCLILFYVLMNKAGETQVQKNLFFALLFSSSLSVLITLLNIFGLEFIPFLTIRGANTVGTITSFAVFLTIMMIFSMGMWLIGKNNKQNFFSVGIKGVITRGLVIFVSLATLFLLIAIDFWLLWVLVIFGMVLLMVSVFLQKKEFGKTNFFIVPLIIVLISVGLLFLTSPLNLKLPLVISPSYGISWSITKQVASEGTMSLIFGSGPGTFSFDYLKYKPDEVNQTIFWDTDFDRAKSQALTTLATFGTAGLGVWLLLVLIVGFKSLRRLFKEREQDEWKATYVLFASWATLVLANLLYSSNMTITFLFWALTGLLASQIVGKKKEIDFVLAPKFGLVFSFAFVLISVGTIVSLVVIGQRYASEVAFAKAVELDTAGASVEQITEKLGEAVSLNSFSDVYYRNLSQTFLLQTSDVIAKAMEDESEIDANEASVIQQLVKAAMASADQAVILSPNNVNNWVQRGNVYRDVMVVVTGAEDVSATSYLTAMKLEDGNPKHPTGLARLYLAVADRARSLNNSEKKDLANSAVEAERSSLTSAEQYLNQAITLKSDYAPAHYYLAAVFERQGKLTEAVARLVELRDYRPLDVGLGFQLAMFYISLKDYDLAKRELERIVELSPDYSNALWYLASMYEIDSNLTKAIEQVTKVAELNPDNQSVQDRLNNLKSGQLTIKVPTPIEEVDESVTTVESGEVEGE